MCEFRFVKMNLVLLFLNVHYVIQKIVKFLSEMSVFCQNLWYNVYSDNFRAGCSKVITSSFLIHGNSSSKTYLANRSFLLSSFITCTQEGTLSHRTPTKQYVSIYTSSFNTNRKMNASKQDPCPQNVARTFESPIPYM